MKIKIRYIPANKHIDFLCAGAGAEAGAGAGAGTGARCKGIPRGYMNTSTVSTEGSRMKGRLR